MDCRVKGRCEYRTADAAATGKMFKFIAPSHEMSGNLCVSNYDKSGAKKYIDIICYGKTNVNSNSYIH